jgi:hypothetical protein
MVGLPLNPRRSEDEAGPFIWNYWTFAYLTFFDRDWGPILVYGGLCDAALLHQRRFSRGG